MTARHVHCDAAALTGGPDHRGLGHGGGRPGWSNGGWLQPGSSARLAGLGLLAAEPGDRARIRAGARDLWVDAVNAARVQVGWDELWGGTSSVGDLADPAERYRTLVLARVPGRTPRTPDERRRFADLVDVCGDRHTRLVVLSAHPPHHVLDPTATDNARTGSRVSLLHYR